MAEYEKQPSVFKKLNKMVAKEIHRPLKIISKVVKSLGAHYKKQRLRTSSNNGAHSSKFTSRNSIENLKTPDSDDCKKSKFFQDQNESFTSSIYTDANCEKIAVQASTTHLAQFSEIVNSDESDSSFLVENKNIHQQSYVKSRVNFFESSTSKCNGGLSKRANTPANKKSKPSTYNPIVQQRINQFEGNSHMIILPNPQEQYECLSNDKQKENLVKSEENNKVNELSDDLDLENEIVDKNISITSVKSMVSELEDNMDESLIQRRIKQLHRSSKREISKIDLSNHDFSPIQDKIKQFDKFIGDKVGNSVFKRAEFFSNLKRSLNKNRGSNKNEDEDNSNHMENCMSEETYRFLMNVCEAFEVPFEEKYLRRTQNDAYISTQNDVYTSAPREEEYDTFLTKLCNLLDISHEEQQALCSNRLSPESLLREYEDTLYQPSLHDCDHQNFCFNANSESTHTSAEYVSLPDMNSCVPAGINQNEQKTFVKNPTNDCELNPIPESSKDTADQSQYFEVNTTVNTTYHSAPGTPMKKLNKEVESKFVVNIFESKTIADGQVADERLKSVSELQKSVDITDEIKTEETKLSIERENAIDSAPIDVEVIIVQKEEEITSLDAGQVSNPTFEIKNEDDQLQNIRDQVFYELKQELDCVSILMNQASKAIDVCDEYGKSNFTMQLIEAQKILLVSGFKCNLLRKEIQKIKFEEINTPSVDTATISISNIYVPLNLIDVNKYSYYLVCVVHCGTNVLGTEARLLDRRENFIRFDEKFYLENLGPDFEMKFEIFGLKMNRRKCMDDLLKGCLSRKEKSRSSKRKIFYRDVQTCTLKENTVSNTSFARLGGFCVGLERAKKYRVWQLEEGGNPILQDKIKFDTIIEDVSFNIYKTGYLNIGTITKGRILWNKQWCMLQGHMLKIFTYPTDKSVKDKGIEIDLKYSMRRKVYDRDHKCNRQWTLLLEIGKKTTNIDAGITTSVKRERYFLNADTIKDLKEWQNSLNAVLNGLAQWNQFLLI